MKAEFKYALRYTVPVLVGYLVLGLSFGVLMAGMSFPWYYAPLMSIFIYAGAMQFAAVELLTASFSPIAAIFLTLMVNIRMLFYGITLLKPFNEIKHPILKYYTIFGLTDETFSILVSLEIPDDLETDWVYFLITLLDHLYWIAGGLLGVLAGQALPIDYTGIEYSLTALFIIMFIEQLYSNKNFLSAAIGLMASAFALFVFGGDHFMIPAMLLIVGAFYLDYRYQREKGHLN